MRDKPPKWQKQTFKIPEKLLAGQEFAVKPGFNVFIADRGAVGFHYPNDWVVVPSQDSIGLHDRKPPNDDCAIHVSVMRLPPVKGGWSQLPLSRLVQETVKMDRRSVTQVGDIIEERRAELELAWAEVRFIDPNEKRPALAVLPWLSQPGSAADHHGHVGIRSRPLRPRMGRGAAVPQGRHRTAGTAGGGTQLGRGLMAKLAVVG